MNQELYYVVTNEVKENLVTGAKTLTGNKEVSLYEVLRNKLTLITSIPIMGEIKPEEAIDGYVLEMAPELFNENQERDFKLTQL